MKKQILTVLLLCLLLTVTLLLVACNDTDDIQKASEGLQYTFAEDDSGFVVTGLGSCTDSEIVIPAVYQDKPVVKLAGGLFRGKTYITGVVLPNSITDIGDSVFSGCTGLTSITFQGTKAQWKQAANSYVCNSNTGYYTIHCTDGDIAKQ